MNAIRVVAGFAAIGIFWTGAAAALAAERAGDRKKAALYYRQVAALAGSNAAARPELKTARAWLAKLP